ncbi:MAG: tRNA lysidine(34) synthetase TilS, partial [Candidatus Krumholzibacteria bacterium]|nr:tRNA lysidine(34) synthetase TilS [Candidatus Krumholzibacteria bacterium]
LGIPFCAGEGDVPARSRRSRTGLEEEARAARYEFLEAAAASSGASAVALAHTRDDQIETVLHHLIRGTGIRGLAGMSPRRGIWIRPVLSCPGNALRAFCRERGVRYAVDPSNSDTSFLRNRIRRVLLPLLRRRFNPAIDEAVLRLSSNAAAIVESTERSLRDRLPPTGRDGGVTIDAGETALLTDLERHLFIDLILRERLGVFQDIDKVHYDALDALVRAGRSGSVLHLPRGLRAAREHAAVRLRRELPGEADPPLPPEMILPGPGRFELPGWGLVVTVSAGPPPARAASGPRSAALAGVAFPLRVRTRRRGDRLVPFGMSGSRKLSDIMIDRAVPLSERDRLPVFEDPSGIVWVPGVVSAERTRIGPATRRAVAIEIDAARDPR